MFLNQDTLTHSNHKVSTRIEWTFLHCSELLITLTRHTHFSLLSMIGIRPSVCVCLFPFFRERTKNDRRQVRKISYTTHHRMDILIRTVRLLFDGRSSHFNTLEFQTERIRDVRMAYESIRSSRYQFHRVVDKIIERLDMLLHKPTCT